MHCRGEGRGRERERWEAELLACSMAAYMLFFFLGGGGGGGCQPPVPSKRLGRARTDAVAPPLCHSGIDLHAGTDSSLCSSQQHQQQPRQLSPLACSSFVLAAASHQQKLAGSMPLQQLAGRSGGQSGISSLHSSLLSDQVIRRRWVGG